MNDDDITFRSDMTVELIKHSASDSDVLWAARVSTLGERSRDEIVADPDRSKGLISYLMRNRHGSVYEHSTMTFFVSAPIFVFREFHRHRAGWSYNEASARYREMEPVFYVPAEGRDLVQVGKPGHYQFEPGGEVQQFVAQAAPVAAYRAAWAEYQAMLRADIAREVARTVLPVGLYSSQYATCNARSLMHFLSLRTTDERAVTPSHPQREIEMVAKEMEELWAGLMPLTYAAFNANGRVAP